LTFIWLFFTVDRMGDFFSQHGLIVVLYNPQGNILR
jgi:hypothetical protein